MTVLVAVVGVTGTAYAGNHGSGDKKHGNDNSRGGKSNGNGNYDFNSHSSHKKHKGDRGAAYGIATVNIKFSNYTPAPPLTNPYAWATYSTRLGSPVLDTTGGSFRFTCKPLLAPCEISTGAAVLGSTDYLFYPRLLVYKQGDGFGGGTLDEQYCEYADGSTNSLPTLVNHQPLSSTPTYAPVSVDIGGSADCGGPDPAAHLVTHITVPAGYYDVHSTFAFIPLP